MNLFKEVSVQGDAITARAYHGSVVFKNRLYVVMGRAANVLGDVYWTDDCQVWHKQGALSDTDGNVIPPVYLYGLCKHNKKVYLMGGQDKSTMYNHVYVTSDMVHWEKLQNAPWTARIEFVALSFDNKIWVMGGYDGSYLNEVWWSTDGVDWKQMGNAPWPARSCFSGVVYNNRIFVIGGHPLNNNVWSTNNGSTWKRDCAAAGFSARRYHSVVKMGDKMILIGGYDGSQKKDMWYSVDGRSWQLISSSIEPGVLDGHSVDYFNNRLVVACGNDGTIYRNNVFIGTDKLLKIQ